MRARSGLPGLTAPQLSNGSLRIALADWMGGAPRPGLPPPPP